MTGRVKGSPKGKVADTEAINIVTCGGHKFAFRSLTRVLIPIAHAQRVFKKALRDNRAQLPCVGEASLDITLLSSYTKPEHHLEFL